MGHVQYISDENNNVTGVIVPIDLWHELQAEKGNRLSLEKRDDERASVAGKKAKDRIAVRGSL